MAQLFPIGKAAKKIGVSIKTLRDWEKKGLIKTIITPGGHRRIEDVEINRLLNKQNEAMTDSHEKRTCIYCRVSTKKQAENGNLDRQEERLIVYAFKNDYKIIDIYKEIASGINENRTQLIKLLNSVRNKEVQYILIEYKDRLARFGYNYLEKYIKDHGGEIIVLNNQEEKDLNQELVEDLISITTSFSARIYGKRGGKRVAENITQILDKGASKNEDGEGI